MNKKNIECLQSIQLSNQFDFIILLFLLILSSIIYKYSFFKITQTSMVY